VRRQARETRSGSVARRQFDKTWRAAPAGVPQAARRAAPNALVMVTQISLGLVELRCKQAFQAREYYLDCKSIARRASSRRSQRRSRFSPGTLLMSAMCGARRASKSLSVVDELRQCGDSVMPPARQSLQARRSGTADLSQLLTD